MSKVTEELAKLLGGATENLNAAYQSSVVENASALATQSIANSILLLAAIEYERFRYEKKKKKPN